MTWKQDVKDKKSCDQMVTISDSHHGPTVMEIVCDSDHLITLLVYKLLFFELLRHTAVPLLSFPLTCDLVRVEKP